MDTWERNAIVALLLGVSITFASISLAYSGPSYIYPVSSCVKAYDYRGIDVCEIDRFSKDDLQNALIGGAVFGNEQVIYIKSNMTFLKEQTIKHEYCHVQQNQENRKHDEWECYIKMWE
jgi:hypothetical protein